MAAVGLPSELIKFTSPIVETALKTGARGSTTTTTNYGVIGDAMFKKAQLDLGIANLKADIGMQEANIKSSLAMEGARLGAGISMQAAAMNQDMAKTMISSNLTLRDMKMELEANEVGFFEALLTDIAGGVSGAATGFMVGGPVGAAIGGAAGFGMTAASQAQGGRRGGQAATQALGTIANGASMIKGLAKEKQGQDAWKSWSDRAQFLADALTNPNLGPSERIGAQAEFDKHMNSGFSVMTNDLNVNPQVASETMKGVRGLYMSPSTDAAARDKDFNMSSMRTAMEAKADSRLDDPAQANEALTDYIAKFTKNYAMANGGKEIPNDVLDAMLIESGIAKRPGIMDIAGTGAESPIAESSQPSPFSLLPKQQVTPWDLGVGGEKAAAQEGPRARGGIKAPKENAIRQAPPAYSAPVKQEPGRAWHPPMVSGPGLQMDDGNPARAEQQLAKQGAETVKTLQKANEPEDDTGRSLKDKLLHGGKVPIIGGVPGLLSGRGIKADETRQEMDEARENKRDWNAEIQEKKPAAAKPFFTEKDPKKIQDAYKGKEKKFVGEEKAKFEGNAAAAAQMNQLREEMEGLWKEEGIDREVLHDYQTWKLGTYGDEGMKGKSFQAGVKGFGAGWGSFEKSVRLSLEGKGVKGKAADRVIQKLKSIDSKVEPLAQSLAVAKQGSRPSDADVAAYKKNLVNLMDPNPDNSIAGLISLQELIYTDFESFMYNTPSRSTFMSQSAEESRAKRMSPGEIQARRGVKDDEEQSYYEKLRDGTRRRARGR